MSFARHTYNNTIYRGLQIVMSFAVNLLIARLFRAEASGILFYWLGILSLLLLIFSLNLNTGIAYYFSSRGINDNAAFSYSLLATALLIIVAGISIALAGAYLSYTFNPWYSLAFLTGNFLVTVFQYLFYAKQDFKTPAVAGIITGLLTIGLGALLFQYFRNAHQQFVDLFTGLYCGSFLLTGIILTIIFYMRWVREIHIYQKVQHDYIKKIIRYSVMALGANILSFLLYRVDYWFVGKYCSLNDLGNYVQVNKLNTMFFILPNIFAINVFIDGAANNDIQQSTAYLEKLSAVLFWIFLPVMLFIVLGGNLLFPVIFGDSFQSMSGYFSRVSPGVLLYIIMMPFASWFAAKNKIYVNFLATAVSLMVMITGNLLFTPKYGANAAALVCSVAYGVNALLIIGYYKVTNGISFFNMIRFNNKDMLLLKKFIRFKIQGSRK